MAHGGKRPGAGRPPATGTPARSLLSSVAWPDNGLRDRLDAYAREHGLSRSAAVVRAVRQMLEGEDDGD